MPLAALSAGLPQSQNRADTIYLPAPCGHRLQGTINEKQGQWLLDTLNTYAKLGEPNYEEVAFHLCELAVQRVAEESQRKRVAQQLRQLLTVRKERDKDVTSRITAAITTAQQAA